MIGSFKLLLTKTSQTSGGFIKTNRYDTKKMANLVYVVLYMGYDKPYANHDYDIRTIVFP